VQVGGIVPDGQNMFYALIAAIKDPNLQLSDIRSFAEAAAAKETEWAGMVLFRSRFGAYSGSHRVQRMERGQRKHVDRAGDAREGNGGDPGKSLERLNLVRPKQGTRDAKQTPRLRVNILLRREKSERLFEQIEDLAATVKKAEGRRRQLRFGEGCQMQSGSARMSWLRRLRNWRVWPRS
jgi:hypothetical protein